MCSVLWPVSGEHDIACLFLNLVHLLGPGSILAVELWDCDPNDVTLVKRLLQVISADSFDRFCRPQRAENCQLIVWPKYLRYFALYMFSATKQNVSVKQRCGKSS